METGKNGGGLTVMVVGDSAQVRVTVAALSPRRLVVASPVGQPRLAESHEVDLAVRP